MSYSILDAIGNTPLVEIRRMDPVPGVTLLAKLEYLNPGGSIKDRAALSMIEQGEKTGALTRDKTVVEATSGNTGIGLAMICAVKGYKLLLTMSESASEERKRILQARGAEILLTPGHKGSDGAIEAVYRLARENPDRYFMTDQYNNAANWQAHYHTTAPEIWDQTKGAVSAVVATLGTSGTLMGLSRGLKRFNPEIRIIGAEPFLGHGIQGLKNMKESYRPDIFDKTLLDEKVNIADDEAFETARRLAREEGLFVGMSSGAAMAVALKAARQMEKGTLVVILPDSGERYLSTSLFQVKDNLSLTLYNSLSRSHELFKPVTPGKASVYTCGPTVHQPLGAAQFRRYVSTDLLCRYLEYRGLSVTHVVNITDLDDKTIQGSGAVGEPLSRFTQRYIDLFKADLERLNIRPAQAYPQVSEQVEKMVQLADTLVEKGFAYEKLNSLYFNIARLPEYGTLSGVDLDKIRLGATVDLDDYEKDNPRDFTLFKRIGLSELKRGICINTRWGNVRPSLHLQCAAISMAYLGERFDLHTGSQELLFPHHENEMAIAMAATGSPLVNTWVHCASVQTDGSLGTTDAAALTLADLEARGWPARAVRFWLLSTHYRRALVLSADALASARKALDKLDRCIQGLLAVTAGRPCPDREQLMYDLRHGFGAAMDNDLKISDVLACLFRTVRRLNGIMGRKEMDAADARAFLELFREINGVLNIFDFTPSAHASEPVAVLMEKRNQARAARDFEAADRIRDELVAMGVELHDNKVDKS